MIFVAQTAVSTAVLCLAIRILAKGQNSLFIRFSMVIGVVVLSAIGVGSLIKGW